jgi:signal transduction histidine kinase
MMRESFHRGAPPWWPTGEPRQHVQFVRRRRVRTRFFRRAAFAAAALLLLAVSGLFALASIVMSRFGLAGWAATASVILVTCVAAIALTRFFGAMRHFASPLGSVMDAADRVAGGDYTVRVREHGPPPIQALVHSFNTMTERLQDADRQRRDLMADVAHELRTPLSVLQGRIEGLIDGVYPRDEGQLSRLLEETHVLSRLIEDLRTLALSDAGVLRLQMEPADLVGLLREVVRSFETEAAARPVSLTLAGATDDATADVDPVRIREVFTNLLSNALRHTPADGAVTVSVDEAGEAVAITVKDSGEGMPAEELARIFDRFYKGAASHGSGLGLTIAKSLVTAHGGQISATSTVGEGTTFRVTLPRQHDE